MRSCFLFSLVVIEAFILGCSDKKTLHVYNWSDYISPDVLASFEREHDCKVVVDSFDSNEAMYAKLKAGASGYDIIVPSSYQVEMLAQEGLLERLDHSRIKNVISDFDHSYDNQILDREFTYSVPYVVTYTGFLYDKSKVNQDEASTWKILSDKSYAGKMTFLDDMREVIGAGLMYNSFSLNSTNQVEIDIAVKTVLSWKENIRKFDAESYKTEVASGMSYIGHGYSSDSAQVIFSDEGCIRSDLSFAYPKEGFCIAFDEFCILKSSDNKDLAHEFIDFMYQTSSAKDNMEYVMGIMPQKNAIPLIPKEYRDFFIPNEEIMKNGQVMKSFISTPHVQDMYNKAWDKIKSIR